VNEDITSPRRERERENDSEATVLVLDVVRRVLEGKPAVSENLSRLIVVVIKCCFGFTVFSSSTNRGLG